MGLLLNSPPLPVGKDQGAGLIRHQPTTVWGLSVDGAAWKGSLPRGRQEQGVEKEAVS